MKTALLVIDAQVAIMEGEAGEPGAYEHDAVLGKIGELLAAARTAGAPVIYVQHEEARYPPMRPGAAGWQIHPSIAPIAGEEIVRKQARDAFYDTPLQGLLERLGVSHLVLSGAESQLCIDTAARRAVSLDYDVILAADAHTTTAGMEDEAAGGPGLTAAQIVAHHNATLANLPHPRHEIVVMPASEVRFTAD